MSYYDVSKAKSQQQLQCVGITYVSVSEVLQSFIYTERIEWVTVLVSKITISSTDQMVFLGGFMLSMKKITIQQISYSQYPSSRYGKDKSKIKSAICWVCVTFLIGSMIYKSQIIWIFFRKTFCTVTDVNSVYIFKIKGLYIDTLWLWGPQEMILENNINDEVGDNIPSFGVSIYLSKYSKALTL